MHSYENLSDIPNLKNSACCYLLDHLLYKLSLYNSNSFIRAYRMEDSCIIPVDIKKLSYDELLDSNIYYLLTCRASFHHLYPILIEKSRKLSYETQGLLLSLLLSLQNNSDFICRLFPVLIVTKELSESVDPYRLISLLSLSINHLTHITLHRCLDIAFSKDSINISYILEMLGEIQGLSYLDISHNPLSINIDSLSHLWEKKGMIIDTCNLNQRYNRHNNRLSCLKRLVLMDCTSMYIKSPLSVDFSHFYCLFLHFSSLQDVVISINQMNKDAIVKNHKFISIVRWESQNINSPCSFENFIQDLVHVYLCKNNLSFYHSYTFARSDDQGMNSSHDLAIVISKRYYDSISLSKPARIDESWTRHGKKHCI